MAIHVGGRGPGHLARVYGSRYPYQIFGSNLRVWHDNQDLSTMFSDFVGTQAAIGSSVALQLDKSQGERRTSLGPELIVNGGFDADTDWTKGTGWTISGGVATRTNTGSVTDLYETGIITANRLYKIVITVSAYTSGNLSVRIGGVTAIVGSNITSPGTYTFYGWGEVSDSRFNLRGDTTFAGSIDNVSCREVITVTEQARGSEIKSSGTVAMTGTATAATYNTTTGEGTANRPDGSNYSYIDFTGETVGRPYFVDIENTGAANFSVRDNLTTIAQVTAGHRRTVFVPAIATSLRIYPDTNGTSIAFTVHSVKECLGTPRYQTTSAQRPILGRHPKGGRRNIATYTETHIGSQLGAAAGTTAPTITGDTYSGTSVEAITFAAGVTGYSVARREGIGAGDAGAWTAVNGTQYTASCYIALSRALTAGESINVYQTGVQGSWDIALTSATTNPTTLQRYSATATANASGGQGTFVFPNGVALTSPVTVYITKFQVEPGSVATNYQAVTATYDCTETGVADCYFLQADGSDDGMVTPAIDLSATDKIGVFAGVRKLSDAATGGFLELSTNIATQNGTFALWAGHAGGGADDFSFNSRGSATQYAIYTDAAVAAPKTVVATGLSDISGDSLIFRLNGVEVATSAWDQGTGNFGNYVLYDYRRGGSSLPFNGLDYGKFIVGTLPDAAQIAAGEAYQNNYIEAY